MNDEKVMIGVSDVMKKMGIGRDRAYEIMKSGEFKTHKVGRRYLVHYQVFENWLIGGKQTPSKK
ncbi:helix-turn-helix domain-containing protein [Paenibacillus sp. GCM10023248]|uniref:helix-turn-helix domain-containing protein n=1 Tax=unclassified Paenibacillus TaxID=185978 RepID=UPI002378364B|nr:helix-turn-helix domain-containing protein [Paenibacillus sp. MAHUQ-63]MDD9265982.1 helix-turn-helix domain-containing protein [Paenibacillus sp. MAHUQ-63]